MIKTVSFDLWHTLIKPNPKYKQVRINYLQQFTDKSVEQINTIFKDVKNDIDDKAEKLGIQFDELSVYEMIINLIEPQKLSAATYHKQCAKFLLDNPPLLMNHTLEVLESLKSSHTLLIASNTVLGSGNNMRLVLSDMKIFHYFKECIFSDEVGYSKPNVEFFKIVHEESHCLSHQILHVGDNQVADIQGASHYGFHTLLTHHGFDVPEAVNDLNVKLKK